MKNNMTSSSVKYKSFLLTKPTTSTQDIYLKLTEVLFALHADTEPPVLGQSKVIEVILYKIYPPVKVNLRAQRGERGLK